MALAVVLDDKIVLEHSFGVSNMGGSPSLRTPCLPWGLFQSLLLPMGVTERTEMTGINVSTFDLVETGVLATDDQFRLIPRERLPIWIAE